MNLVAVPEPPVIPDLSVEKERELLAIIERAHSGNSPTWRALAMHRDGARLYEVAEWLGAAEEREDRRYSVLTWELGQTTLAVRWQKRLLTRRGAMRVFGRLCVG